VEKIHWTGKLAAAVACAVLVGGVLFVAASPELFFQGGGQVTVNTITTTTTVIPPSSAIMLSAEVDGQACGISGMVASCPGTTLSFTHTVNQTGGLIGSSSSSETFTMKLKNTGQTSLMPNVNFKTGSGGPSVIAISGPSGTPVPILKGANATYTWLITPNAGGSDTFNATVLFVPA
jgi:hypothetical protein